MMRRQNAWLPWIWMIVILLTMPGWTARGTTSVAYTVRWINKTRVHVISVDLNNPAIKVKPVLAYNTPGRRRSFIGFMAEYQPIAQITGSYFSLDSALPIGDIVSDRQIRYRGPVGSALAIKPDNNAEIVNIPYGWTYSWPGYENVLQGGLRLVQNGKYAVFPKDQGFRDPGLFRNATRTAVGLDGPRHLLLVAVNKEILLSDLAAIMKGLGCRDAMTLDGGTSTGLAYLDNVIFTPGRTLSNVLMVTMVNVSATAPAPTPTPTPAVATAINAQATATINTLIPPIPNLDMNTRISDLLLSFNGISGTLWR